MHLAATSHTCPGRSIEMRNNAIAADVVRIESALRHDRSVSSFRFVDRAATYHELQQVDSPSSMIGIKPADLPEHFEVQFAPGADQHQFVARYRREPGVWTVVAANFCYDVAKLRKQIQGLQHDFTASAVAIPTGGTPIPYKALVALGSARAVAAVAEIFNRATALSERHALTVQAWNTIVDDVVHQYVP